MSSPGGFFFDTLDFGVRRDDELEEGVVDGVSVGAAEDVEMGLLDDRTDFRGFRFGEGVAMVECRCYGNSWVDSYEGGPRGERRVVKGLVEVGWSNDPRLAQQGKLALATGYRAHQPEALNDCSTYLRREGTAWTTGAGWCQASRHSV